MRLTNLLLSIFDGIANIIGRKLITKKVNILLYFGALGSVGPTPTHLELGGEKAEGV